MTYAEAAKRAVATFIFGALSTPLSSTVLDVSAVKVAFAAGIAAVFNFAYRAAESYLSEFEVEA